MDYSKLKGKTQITMGSYRKDRINEEVAKELSLVLRTVKDPRVADAFVSIIKAEVSGDLKFAKVYYSVLGGDKKEVAQGLRSSAGYIRRSIAKNMNLRVTPEFTFIEDNSISHGAHIASVLNSLDIKPESDEEDESSGADD